MQQRCTPGALKHCVNQTSEENQPTERLYNGEFGDIEQRRTGGLNGDWIPVRVG
jgi:hypothetical protein